MNVYHPKRTGLALALLALTVSTGAGQVARGQESLQVRVTYYLPTGNVMYGGQMPYYGAAACSWNLALGTRLRFPDGAEFTCADRGLLGNAGWADLYAPTPEVGREFLQRYGSHATVEVVR